MKKIIICTTFREFNGNENAQMQNLFLESLKSQTYKNFELIVTIFNEKNVEKELLDSKLPFQTHTNPTSEYRFSLSEVLLNGLKSVTENDIIVWTTSDIIFNKDFLEITEKEVRERTCAISYPLKIYNDFECYKNNNSKTFYSGIDVVVFNADIFLKNKKSMDDLIRYKFINWGMFEFFLIGIGTLYAKKLFIIAPNSIKKIENNRKANNENEDYFQMSNDYNRKSFESFTKSYSLDNKFYEWILKFKIKTYNPITKIELYLNLHKPVRKIIRKIKKLYSNL
jgi:hypothetical protein